MNEIIKKNRKLLQIYCGVARTIGCVLLILPGIIVTVAVASGSIIQGKYRAYMLYLLLERAVLNFVLLGLILLGVAKFIRYLYESGHQPSWILRNGDKILYLYAAALVVGSVVQYFFQMTVVTNVKPLSSLPYLIPVLLHATAKGVILVGLGHALRRVMPVIEESKTLV